MKLRKLTSLTALLASALMLLTSIVLYVVPQGRIAYWSDWRLWGLTKTDWGNLHIHSGMLLLTAISFHVYFNWKPMISYLISKRIRLISVELSVALIITLACVSGTYLLVPPFSWVITLNEQVKENGARKYGEPPFGHAELSSLSAFARKVGLDLEESLVLLEKAGFPVEDANMTLIDIASRYRTTPRNLYSIIKPAGSARPKGRRRNR
jgi:hypothetical protein